MVKLKFVILFFILFTVIIYSQNNIYSEFSFETDNESNIYFDYYLNYSRTIKLLEIGVITGIRTYEYQDGTYYSNNYKEFGLFVSFDSESGITSEIQVTKLNSIEWSPYTFNFTVSQKMGDIFTYEISGEEDLVGTAYSNTYKLKSSTYASSIDIMPYKYITVVLCLYSNSISDGNYRIGQKYRIVYTTPMDWLFFDVKAKILSDGFESEYYFSPTKLEEYIVGFGTSLKLSEHFVIKTYAGGGLQTVDRNIHNGLYIGDLKFRGNINDNFSINTNIGITNSNNDFDGNYLYLYGYLKLLYKF